MNIMLTWQLFYFLFIITNGFGKSGTQKEKGCRLLAWYCKRKIMSCAFYMKSLV